MIEKFKQNRFLFSQLVKRDFTRKYKRTILGMGWSMISPMVNLLIMYVVFSRLLGSNIEHYAMYLFSGQMVFAFFTESTNQGMSSLINNSDIFTKINIPKYLFLLSQNVASLINFGLTLLIYFIFVPITGITFHIRFISLVIPILCLTMFNIGCGLILSAFQIFFRDMGYLWGIATQLIMWLSAIFYSVDTFDVKLQKMFLLNPLYIYIKYFRVVVLDGNIPSLAFQGLCFGYAFLTVLIGGWIYKHYNHKFLYYV